jgi:UDP-GlcNAc:undecaprenyl-phosphate/decaprenyl-phosphate GlcNAc-1-phosphate transferase
VAIVAFLIAAGAVGLLLVPLSSRLAVRLGVVDVPGGRRIHQRAIPRLGGLAIMGGILVAVAVTLDTTQREYRAILVGATLISLLGAVDDAVGLRPAPKFLGQAACAVIPVANGVTIDHLTPPFLSSVSIGVAQYPVTVIFIVAIANIVNFADGMDGLAAGMCAISAATFSVLAISLDRDPAAVLAAAVSGACVGFLWWNFHPAKVFMGDSGSLPLGFLLATMSISGVMKTAAAVSLVFPLLVLLVPIMDTTFVILKRLKYGRSILSADTNHFHHRLLRIGFGQRRAALVLYAWCASLSAFALAVRFIHYRSANGHSHLGATLLLSAFALVAIGLSLWVIYVLEILKYRHLRMVGIARRADIDPSTPVIAERRRRRALAGR